MTAGGGMRPFQPFIHSSMLKKTSFSMKTSRCVILRAPSSVSCTMPMTGRFEAGVTMRRGTAMSSCASAMAGSVCSACMFISSPSKSAL